MSTKLNTFVALAALLLFLPSHGMAGQRFTMDFSWSFTTANPEHAESSTFNDFAWRKLDLPHDWAIEGGFDRANLTSGSGGYVPSGIAWYRKHFATLPAFAHKQVTVQFDGIYMNADVYFNGHLIGHQPYGYTSFVCDLTPFLSDEGKDNVLAVKVDTTIQPDSRWYAGAGVYRHVWADVTDDIHVASWGTYVTTPKITVEAATIQFQTRIKNDSNAPRSIKVMQEVVDTDGKVVAKTQGLIEVAAGVENTSTLQATVPHPALWTLDKPVLYTVNTTLSADNETLDTYRTPIGIRQIEFNLDKGFLLNGQRTKILGMCVHPDGGASGAAVPDGVWERRLKLLKAMGCNAIRCSHNPPSPEFLDLCDRLGFLVMDEAFDEWTKPKGQLHGSYSTLFKDWSQKDLIAMLRRDRNHPSIILWSVGNEIQEQSSDNGAALLKPLVDTCHAEDPTRLVTSACDKVNSPTPTKQDFLSLLDVAGYNYVDRWGIHREIYFSDDREKFPGRRFIGTEDVCIGGTRGNYFTPEFARPTATTAPALPTNPFFYVSSMIRAEQLWKFNATHDYVSGYFMWTGVDYLGEASWPRHGASSGVLDTCGFPKDGYYFYQSQWTSQPMLHLLPHWNYPCAAGTVIPVIAYSNCQSVELFLNGKSFGTKSLVFPRPGSSKSWNDRTPTGTTADLHLQWDVPYEPGTLLAIGKRDGQIVAKQELQTAGSPAQLSLVVDKNTLDNASREVANIELRIQDAQGTLVPTANNAITFDIQGPGKILATDNGDLSSSDPYQSPKRKAFNGMCLAIIQATASTGPIHITAKSNGLPDARIDLQVNPGQPLLTLP